MIKKRHIFCAAFCVAVALFLGACAGCAGSNEAISPGPGASGPAPGSQREEGAPSPDPDVLPANGNPLKKSGPEGPLPVSGPQDAQGSPEPSEVLAAVKDADDPTTPEGGGANSVPKTSQEGDTWEPTGAVEHPPISDVVVPAQAEPVGDEYFDDAAFVGNSLVDGFRMFSGLTNCDYYAKASMTILGVGDYLTQMSSIEYGKVYMLLGINELTYSLDKLMEAYGRAVDRITKDHPGVLIYIMGVSPVSAAKDASSKTFTMANVRRFNERLIQLAEEKNCYYIDLCDAMGGDDGFLSADVTTDGIHFKPSGYKVWLDYLRYHYAPAAESGEDPAAELTEEPEPESGEDPAAEATEEPEPAEDPAAEPTPELEPEIVD